jgi:hypothetical protein
MGRFSRNKAGRAVVTIDNTSTKKDPALFLSEYFLPGNNIFLSPALMQTLFQRNNAMSPLNLDFYFQN